MPGSVRRKATRPPLRHSSARRTSATSRAQIALSHLLLHGRGVAPDAYQAYFWATMARHRTPPGPLLEQANASAAAAARSLSASLIEDAERMVKEIMSAYTTPR